MAEVLNELTAQGLSAEHWVAALREQQLGTATALGSLKVMERAAKQRDKRWLRGMGLARRVSLDADLQAA